MGYRYGINQVEVLIESPKVPEMLKALSIQAKQNIRRKIEWEIKQHRVELDTGYVRSATYKENLEKEIREYESTLQALDSRELSRHEILANLEWRYSFDALGRLTDLSHVDETRSLDEAELEAIAPFVREDSFIEVSGEDFGDIFRFVFRGGELQRISAVITYPEM